MTEAAAFRLYADEALRESFVAASEDEKRVLEELALTWARAAVASERAFGPDPTLWPRDTSAMPVIVQPPKPQAYQQRPSSPKDAW
jgi:hypothetical protein